MAAAQLKVTNYSHFKLDALGFTESAHTVFIVSDQGFSCSREVLLSSPTSRS